MRESRGIPTRSYALALAPWPAWTRGWVLLGALAVAVSSCASVEDAPCPSNQVADEDGNCIFPCELANCSDDNDCTEDACTNLDDGTYECAYPHEEDDTTCTVGMSSGWCVSGQCDLCARVNCEDGSACVLGGTCDAATGQCEGGDNAPDRTECVASGNPGTCLAGVCEGLCQGVVCDQENACTDNECNPADGECEATPLEDGTACDFGELPGRCVSGLCTDASPPSVFLSSGSGVISSANYEMGIFASGPVGHGSASSSNYTLEFRVPVNQ